MNHKDIHFAEPGLLWIEYAADIDIPGIANATIPVRLWFEYIKPPDAWRETVRLDDVTIVMDYAVVKFAIDATGNSLVREGLEKEILKTIQSMRDEAADR